MPRMCETPDGCPALDKSISRLSPAEFEEARIRKAAICADIFLKLETSVLELDDCPAVAFGKHAITIMTHEED